MLSISQGVGSPGFHGGNGQQNYGSPANMMNNNNYSNGMQGGQSDAKGFSAVQQEVRTWASHVIHMRFVQLLDLTE